MGKKYKQFSLEERCEIARLRADGQSIRQIAAALGRAASSISREVRRNGGSTVGYKPVHADELRWARRWRGSRLARQPDLYQLVMNKLVMGWSPEQISGRLALEHSAISISHESIYRFIYAQIARTQDYRWRHYLPRAKSKRGRSRRSFKSMDHIKDRVSLDKRPSYINKRRQPGHWETDLIMLSDKKHNLLVAQERCSRYTLIAKQNDKCAQPTVDRLKAWLAPLPAPLRRTLTQDNGPEFFEHHQLNPLGIKTYFCKPRSPWQKGGIENMNGRIRRYIPLKTKPDSFTNDDVQRLASRLNATPRKCLGFKTPSEVFLKQFQPLHLECESTCQPSLA
jgi:transposase, IS30 family